MNADVLLFGSEIVIFGMLLSFRTHEFIEKIVNKEIMRMGKRYVLLIVFLLIFLLF